jgi:glucose/arabinose dehydrogenase
MRFTAGKLRGYAVSAAAALLLSACYNTRPSTGGGQTTFSGQRTVNPTDIALPAGYRAEVLTTGLTYPTGVAVAGDGSVYVTESGYSYGEDFTEPRLLRIGRDGRKKVVLTGGNNGPWTGVTYANGALYVAEGGALEGGRILRVTPAGQRTVLVSGLPSFGDHHTDGPAVGPDGWIYFGQGTATNAGVVGPDNLEFGWLKRKPQFHDRPCEDIVLTGQNFTSPDVLTGQGTAQTGAFLPFGTPTTPGQVIRGQVPCSGSVMRIPPGGGRPQLVAWGFRNPFGLAFSPSGKLYVTDNGYDDRGSRPVWGVPDVLWEVRRGAWHGWPDFSAGEPLTKPDFKPPGKAQPSFLLEHKKTPPAPAARLGVHSSANGLDFSRSASFGHVGEAFIALFGDQAPETGKVTNPVGFKVVRVNVENGAVEDFAVNKGRKSGPASLLGGGGLERPLAARFSLDGSALYVADFGVMTMSQAGPNPVRGTGVIWKISRE